MRTYRHRGVVSWVVIGLSIALAGCGARATAGQSPPADPVSALPVSPELPAPAPVPVPMSAGRPTDTAAARFDPATITEAVRSVEPSATVGVLVVDRTSGADLVAVNVDRPFRSASLVKLLIAIDSLTAGAAPRRRDQINRMLRLSDDDVASALWSVRGGPAIVTRTSKLIGLTGTRPPRTPGRWGDVLLTPRDVGGIYDYVLTGLPAPDRDLIVDALAGAPRRAADGFDQYFGIPDGLGGPWAIKQGWSNSATDIVLHSSGLVGPDRRYEVVLLTEHPRRTSWRRAADSVTAGAKALSPLLQSR